MQTRNQSFGTTACRPVTTERDYVGAVTCLIRMAQQKPLDPATESRRMKLVRAVHDFDSDPFTELDAVAAEQVPDDYDGNRRRWSDIKDGWS